jgi:hypothetical protein
MENNVKKIYSFQKRFTYVEAPLFSLILAMLSFSWFPAVLGIFMYGALFPSTIRFGLFLDITAIFSIFIVFLIKKEMKKSAFVVTEDALVFKSAGKLITLFFTDIVLCKHQRHILNNGHIQVCSAERTITLPYFIHGIYDLLLNIHEGLIENGTAKAVDESTLESMFSISKERKFAYQREKNAFHPLIASTLFLTFLNLVIGYKYWELEITPVLMWSAVGFLSPICTFIVAEFMINSTSRKINKPTNGLLYDQSILSTYMLSAIAFLIIYLAAGILFKTFY